MKELEEAKEIKKDEICVRNFLKLHFKNVLYSRYDNVTIYEDQDLEVPTDGPFCGNDIPKAYTSSGRYAAVNFISDPGKQHQGFELSYKCKEPKICKDQQKRKFCKKQKKIGNCKKEKVAKKCQKTCDKC